MIPVAVAAVGSLAPDIDSDKATLNQWIRKVTHWSPWTHLTHHRGICHRWYFGAALALLLYLLLETLWPTTGSPRLLPLMVVAGVLLGGILGAPAAWSAQLATVAGLVVVVMATNLTFWTFIGSAFLAGFLSHLLLDIPRKPGLVLEWATRGAAMVGLLVFIAKVPA